jgi:sorbose reductase
MSGSIVNYPQRQVAYHTSKAGAVMSTRGLAAEWKPSELNGAVVYLASGASKLVTGHDLIIDAGYTSW